VKIKGKAPGSIMVEKKSITELLSNGLYTKNINVKSNRIDKPNDGLFVSLNFVSKAPKVHIRIRAPELDSN